MNEVITKEKVESVYRSKSGDILVNKNIDRDFYILGVFSNDIGIKKRYVAINLSDGDFWSAPTSIIENAIVGLSFYKRNAKIMIQ